MGRFIPLSIPNFKGNERKYVDDAVDQGWVSTGGAYITKFEEQLEAFLNVPNIAACQSGTSALHLSLIEIGVQPGDAVIVTPLTFIAAVNPVKYQFAEPIFIDCDESLCIDPIKLREFCEQECDFQDEKLYYKKHHIKAIIVVHIFGNMADMESVIDIAQQYNFKVVEDATEALGTKYTYGKFAGMYAGTIGDFGAFSFNGNKVITTGGGGAITAKNPETVDHLRYLSTQAKDDPHYYIHDEIGYNYRMTNIQAALGVAQMEELPEFIRIKQDNFKIYTEIFSDFKYGKLWGFREGTDSNHWFYSLKIDREYIHESMREIITTLEKDGVQTRAIWGLIHEQKPYLGAIKYKIEEAKYYSETILNIPSSTTLSEDDIRFAGNKIKEVLSRFAVSK